MRNKLGPADGVKECFLAVHRGSLKSSSDLKKRGGGVLLEPTKHFIHFSNKAVIQPIARIEAG
jgi:hypothetical protein